MPDHRTVPPQRLVRVPGGLGHSGWPARGDLSGVLRSGIALSGAGHGRIRKAEHAAAGTSVGESARISGDAARSWASRQRADLGDPEIDEARVPSPRLGRVEIPR